MSKGKKILNVLVYALLAIVLWMQVLSLVAIIGGPSIFGAGLPTKLREAKALIPTWIIMVLMVYGAVVLCKVWKDQEKKSLIPMVLGILGAVLALLIALTLRTALPLQAAGSNVSRDGAQGLTGWELFWRHFTPMGVGIVTAIVSFVHFKSARDERLRKVNEGYKEHFVLDGDPLFTDEEKDREPVATSTKKLSKKQRKELREKENGGK